MSYYALQNNLCYTKKSLPSHKEQIFCPEYHHMATKKFSYEQSMQRIEAIVEALENGEANLDTLSVQALEAQKLIAQCKKQLTKLEDILTTNFDIDGQR